MHNLRASECAYVQKTLCDGSFSVATELWTTGFVVYLGSHGGSWMMLPQPSEGRPCLASSRTALTGYHRRNYGFCPALLKKKLCQWDMGGCLFFNRCWNSVSWLCGSTCLQWCLSNPVTSSKSMLWEAARLKCRTHAITRLLGQQWTALNNRAFTSYLSTSTRQTWKVQTLEHAHTKIQCFAFVYLQDSMSALFLQSHRDHYSHSQCLSGYRHTVRSPSLWKP